MYAIRIEYVGPVPGSMNLRQREWNAVVREAWRQCGLYWVTQFRGKHFTTAGGTEYGYAPRSGERGRMGKHGFQGTYTQRKLKTKGHTRPLVHSGRSEQATRSPRIHAVATRNKSGVDVIMRAPALNFKRSDSPVNMRKEMTTISPREAVALVRLHRRIMEAKMRAIKTKTTTNR